MKLIGVLLAIFGWLLPVVGLGMTSSTGARIVICLVGIGITLTAILKLLLKDHEKVAVWKQ
ncbi:MAG: hypothetical protein ACRD3H_10410 [Terriglobales bacterium]|jgi:hypothetical protein|nr:hypothetical protein [Terriglobales bacterium]